MPGTDVPSVVLLSEQVVSTPDTLSSGVDVQSSSSSSGMVHWNEQTTVFTAQNLNSHTYRGHSEWKTLQRQPRSPERRMPKKSRRKTTMKRAKHYKYIYYEQGLCMLSLLLAPRH